MNDAQIIDVFRRMALAGVKVAGPVLAVILVIGVVVSILQTITQIQEQAIVFVLKFAAVGIILVVMGPWMLQVLSSLVYELWSTIPEIE
ncbi:MAG: flagellar biosynthetic protein FliQ [Ilumatobacteraceae bacterium]